MRFFLALLCFLPATAPAYTLVTSVSESCHERLTFEAIAIFLDGYEDDGIFIVPTDRVTRTLMELVRQSIPRELSDREAFLAMSIIVGVRAPDTEGHSTLDLSAIRRLHADPDPVGQYAHALRGPDDDGLRGDLIAIKGTKQVIRDELAIGATYFSGTENLPIEKRGFFVDHYDTVDVSVGLAAYHLGRAIHALQDAHAHMVRKGERYEHIVHVTNYVDAVNGTLEHDRDGLAHSNALDDCNRDDVEPIAEWSKRRSAAVVRAFNEQFFTNSTDAIERGLSPCLDEATNPENCGWIEYDPECQEAVILEDEAGQAEHCCTKANDFCSDTVPAAAIAKKEPAGPYLGCATAPGGGGGWAWLLLVAAGLFRRRNFAVVALFFCLLPTSAQADPPKAFIAADGHFATLNDTPNASLLNIEYGYSARFGYRYDRWRFIGLIDRSYWVPLEFGVQVDGGTLNLGAGVEALFIDDYIRVGLAGGASILMFDAVFDEAGTTGYFVEIRPAGLRWEVAKNLIIVFDPIFLSVLHPVVRDPPLRKVHRRTSVGLEWAFL